MGISYGIRPGGSDTQVQFNDGGAFGGNSALAFFKSSDPKQLNVLGGLGIAASNLTGPIGGLLSVDAQVTSGNAYAISSIVEYNGTVNAGPDPLVAVAGTVYNNSSGVVGKAAAIFADNGATTDPSTLTENNGVLISNMSGMGLTNYALHIRDQGTGATDYAIKVEGGKISFTGLPTSDPLVADQLWNNHGVLCISAG